MEEMYLRAGSVLQAPSPVPMSTLQGAKQSMAGLQKDLIIVGEWVRKQCVKFTLTGCTAVLIGTQPDIL